jgi:hypothetical protein
MWLAKRWKSILSGQGRAVKGISITSLCGVRNSPRHERNMIAFAWMGAEIISPETGCRLHCVVFIAVDRRS